MFRLMLIAATLLMADFTMAQSKAGAPDEQASAYVTACLIEPNPQQEPACDVLLSRSDLMHKAYANAEHDCLDKPNFQRCSRWLPRAGVDLELRQEIWTNNYLKHLVAVCTRQRRAGCAFFDR